MAPMNEMAAMTAQVSVHALPASGAQQMQKEASTQRVLQVALIRFIVVCVK